MTLSNQTIEILEDIERRLDPEAEDDYMKQWEDFLYDRFDGGVFTPRRKPGEPIFSKPEEVSIIMNLVTTSRLVTVPSLITSTVPTI